jgi:hypothetical protein
MTPTTTDPNLRIALSGDDMAAGAYWHLEGTKIVILRLSYYDKKFFLSLPRKKIHQWNANVFTSA